jgi:hypothetical protein
MSAIAAGSLSPASDRLQDVSRFRQPGRKQRTLAAPRAQGPEERLDSWKEIAAYVKRTVRTAQRWEEHEGLPVRRLAHSRLASVYAFKCELDAWWESRCVVPVNESGHLSGRNSEFSHVGKGRRTLTLLIRIEIVEGAGRAHTNDSESAGAFVSNNSGHGRKNVSIGSSTKPCLGLLLSDILRQTFNVAPCRLLSVRSQSMVAPAALNPRESPGTLPN